jgi:hypothetical protein
MVSAWIPLTYDGPLAFACRCPYSCAQQTPQGPNLLSSQKPSTSALPAPVWPPHTFCGQTRLSISPSQHPPPHLPVSCRARPRPSPPESSAKTLRAKCDFLGWNSSSHLSKVLPLWWTASLDQGRSVTSSRIGVGAAFGHSALYPID